MQKSLNALLPSSIRVLAIKKQPVSFHPTLDVIEKEYRYYICNSKIESPINRNFAWHCPYKLDLKYMNLACQKLTGTHDFKALCNSHKDPQPKSTIRTINEIKIIKLPDNQLRIDVLGKNFLFRMVRNIVGLLIYVGRQKILATELEQILISKDRTKAGITAPAHGLFLHRVSYEDANEFSSCDQLLV